MLHLDPANGRQTMPNGHTSYPTLAANARRLADRFPRAQYPGTVDELTALADGVDSMAAELARTRQELADSEKLAANRLEELDVVGPRTDRFGARVAVMTHQLAGLVAYADAQPCMCPSAELRTDPDAEPCDRCKALGRRNDEPVEP